MSAPRELGDLGLVGTGAGLAGWRPRRGGDLFSLHGNIRRPHLSKHRTNGVQRGPQGLETVNSRSRTCREDDPDVPSTRRVDQVRRSIARARGDDDPVMEGRVIVATIAYVCRGDVTRRGQPLGHQSAFLWRESTRWKLAYSIFHNVYYSQATEWVKEMIVG